MMPIEPLRGSTNGFPSTLDGWPSMSTYKDRAPQLSLATPQEHAATPRRVSPDAEISGLNEFFNKKSGMEWVGVVMRQLPYNTTIQDVRRMLLFSRGVQGVRLVRSEPLKLVSPSAEAYVRFSERESAEEAQRVLNGKDLDGQTIQVTLESRPRSADIYKMASSMESLSQDLGALSTGPSSSSDSDGMPPTPAAFSPSYTTSRQLGSPIGLSGVNGTNGSARMGDNSLSSALASGDFYSGLTGSRSNGYLTSAAEQDAFSPHERSSQSNGLGYGYDTQSYLSESALLPDSNDHVPDGYGLRPRRQTNPVQPAGSRFGVLPPLSTAVGNGYAPMAAPMTAPPGPAAGLPSPMSTPTWGNTPVNRYTSSFSATIAHPPANPADQNPPCNTLYVGNLPAQTSEDELKQLFVRQRGYKRMCFRTKPQGPMCFVEFEDTGYATKALTELYGKTLSNSTKGGVRLSFSKNPLGVRSNNNPQNPANQAALRQGVQTPSSTGFSTAIHNPPGLPPPQNRLPPIGHGVAPASESATPSSAHPPGLFSPNGMQQSVREQTPIGRPPGLGNSATSSRFPPGLSSAGSSALQASLSAIFSPVQQQPVGSRYGQEHLSLSTPKLQEPISPPSR